MKKSLFRFTVLVLLVLFGTTMTGSARSKKSRQRQPKVFKKHFRSFKKESKNLAFYILKKRKGLKHRVETLEEDVNLIKTQITTIQADILAQNENIASLQVQIDELSVEAEENAAEIATIQNSIATIEAQIAQQKTELLELIGQLTQELANQREELSDLTLTVSDMQASTQDMIDDINAEIQALREEVENNQAMTAEELAEINFQITALIADAQSLSSEISALQIQYNDLLSQLTTLESTVASNYSYLESRSWDLSGNNLYYSKGSVGIGTSSPGQKLSVNGNMSITGRVIPSGFAATGGVVHTGVYNAQIHSNAAGSCAAKGAHLCKISEWRVIGDVKSVLSYSEYVWIDGIDPTNSQGKSCTTGLRMRSYTSGNSHMQYGPVDNSIRCTQEYRYRCCK